MATALTVAIISAIFLMSFPLWRFITNDGGSTTFLNFSTPMEPGSIA